MTIRFQADTAVEEIKPILQWDDLVPMPKRAALGFNTETTRGIPPGATMVRTCRRAANSGTAFTIKATKAGGVEVAVARVPIHEVVALEVA